MGRESMHQAAQVGDPDETLPRPVFPGEGQAVYVPQLPIEEQGFAHRGVEAETVGLYESVRLQMLVRFHILAHARRYLEPRGVECGEEQECAELPDVLVTGVQCRLSLC